MKKNSEKKKKFIIRKNGKLRGEIVEKNDIDNEVIVNDFQNVDNSNNDLFKIEDLIDPLKKYEYVEEKNKNISKYIVYCFFTLVLIVLIIFSYKLINDRLQDNTPVVHDSTTTSHVVTTTTSVQKKVNRYLSCNLDSSVQGVYQKNYIKFSFIDNALVRYDNDYYIILNDEAYINKYNELVQYLKLTALTLDDDVKIETIEENYTYKLSAGVDLTNTNDGYGYSLNQSYDEILNNMIAANYICE